MQSQQKEQTQDPQVFDEKPIGGNQKQQQMMSEYPPDFNPDQLNIEAKPEPLPLAKRVHSKVWKIRKQAFQQLLSEVTQSWTAYQQFLKDTNIFITDSNPLCQERALKVFLKYLEGASDSIQQPRNLIKALLEKCLIVQKGQIANLATQILFWLMDNHPQILLNQVNQNILNKNPKICGSTISFLEKLLNNYGARKLKMLEQFGKSFTLLSSSVRPIAKPQSINLFKQMFRWMGENALSFSMHPEVKQEVVKFSKTYVKEPMLIKRGLNEEQKKGTKPITESMGDDENQQPQDVLIPYDSRWVDKVLEQEKWKDKKALLDQFIKKTKAKNIVPRQSSHFITLIKRLLTDNNINLLQCGFRVVKNLCTGLKRNFCHPCKVVLTPMFSKLRDTKAMIVDQAQQTLQAMMNCLTIQDLFEDIKQGLKDKAPNMRLQTLRFIDKLLGQRDKKMMPTFKNLSLQIIDLNEDGSSEVRDKTLEVLCKLKSVYGLNFFGDKLKKIQGKKLQTIQNYIDPNENKIDEQPIEEKASQAYQKQGNKKPLKAHSQLNPSQSQQSQYQQLSSKSGVATQPMPKTNPLNASTDFESTSEAIRQQAYQNLQQKQPQVIYQQLIQNFKNKQVFRESNPNVLKLILACVKKSVHNLVGLQHMQFLMQHDWKKCKPLLIEFIQSNKLNLPALQYVKNQGILAPTQGPSSKRNISTEKSIEKQATSNYGSQLNNIQPHSAHSNHSTQNSLKVFYGSIQGLIPKMSNPDPVVRLQAADTAMQLLRPIAAGAPNEASEPNPSITEAISQLFSVLKYRIQDSNEEISNNYIKLVTQMLEKGFLNKYRTPGRVIISMLLQKLSNTRLTNLSFFIKEMANNNSVILWQFLASQLSKQTMCNSVLSVIKQYYESFFKNADQKTYILPLLTCISKDVEAQRCGQLLDQIVEINGEQSLEKVVKESKISGYSVQNYLKKWNIHNNQSSHAQKHKSASSIQGNNLMTVTPVHSKLQRINSESQNPWPLTPSATHIIKMMSQMIAMGEPFQTLASPTLLTEQEMSIISNLRNQVIEDYSDILAKWVFWRMHIQSQPKNIEQIFGLVYRVISIGFELDQSQIVTLLGAIVGCLNLHKGQYLKQAIRINQFFNQHPLYKQKAFRFWINSFNDPTAPVDQILNLIVHSFPDMIPSEMVTLARFPAVVRNKQFNQYLRSNYNQKLLTVYGFKLQDVEKKNIISQHLNEQMLTEVEAKYFVEMFQRSSSADLVEKIASDTEAIAPQFVMQAHLKIMHSIIVPYLHRELSFINVYNYFKHVQKIIVTANSSPFLLSLVRTLSYFLIDLDELKLQNFSQMLKTINKLLLILLQISQPKHILQVLFILMKNQLKTGQNSKLGLLLPKCIGKVIKNPIFKIQNQKSHQKGQCVEYIVRELIEILCTFEIGSESSLMKTIKNLLGQLGSLFPASLDVLQKLMQTNAQNIPERVQTVVSQIVRDRSRQNPAIQKIESSYMSSENSYVQSKDIKNAANMMKALKSVVGEHIHRKNVQKQKMGQ